MPFTRREFITKSVLGLGAFYLSMRSARAWGALARLAEKFPAAHPWRAVKGAFAGTAFLGDEHHHPHDALWHTETYIAKKGGRPAEVERTCEVIIVGGGCAGLLSAYGLKDRDFLLLEQAAQFGGNARSETYQGEGFSLGPAYVTIPERGSALETFYQDLGLLHEARREAPEDGRVLSGGLKFLESEPGEVGTSARALKNKMLAWSASSPELPPSGAAEEAATAALDELSAESWLRREGSWHPLLWEHLQLYAWSSFGGSLEEISAAQFLNFYAAEARGVMAWAGGNGAITRRLFERLSEIPGDRLRAGTLVLEVKEVEGGVEVLAENPDGTLRRLRAKAAVMAAPKYAARLLLRGMLPPERDALWNDLPYRAYAVANVLLKQPIAPPAFDLYCLRGSVPETPSFGHRTDRPITDLIFAGWANGAEPSRVLTLYRPYPLDGARNFLLGPSLHERLQKEFGDDLKRWLAELDLAAVAIEGIRVALWGHSVPLARVGFLKPAFREALSAPVGPRVFLANQDNFMSPSFESCFAAATHATADAQWVLGH